MSLFQGTLPGEVSDCIIDYLWDDPQSLCNCAVLCRAWLYRSRYHLYGKMRILGRKSFDLLVQSSKKPGIRNLFEHLSRLELVELNGSSKSGDSQKPWVHLLPFSPLANWLRQVTYLSIKDLDFSVIPLHPTVFLVGFPSFAHVETLCLSGCIFKSFRQFQRLLSSFAQLHILSVLNVDWNSDSSPEGLSRGFHPRIINFILETKSTTNAHLLHWLIAGHCGTSLTDLTLSTDDVTVCEAFGRLIETAGEILENLGLQIIFRPFPAEISHYFNLSRSVHLRTLKLRIPYHISVIGSLLPTLLSQLSTGSHFEQLEVVLFVASEDGIVDQFDWSLLKRVDQILGQKHFSRLQAVILMLYALPHNREEIQSLLHQRETIFVELSRRGTNVQLASYIWDEGSGRYHEYNAFPWPVGLTAGLADACNQLEQSAF